MTKRIKPGYCKWADGRKLHLLEKDGGLVLFRYHSDGWLANSMYLTARDAWDLGFHDAVEDAPTPKTPGQRLFEEVYGKGWENGGPAHRESWEAKAARLGVK